MGLTKRISRVQVSTVSKTQKKNYRLEDPWSVDSENGGHGSWSWFFNFWWVLELIFSNLKANSNKYSRFLLLFCLAFWLWLCPLLFVNFQRIDQPRIILFRRLIVWNTQDLYQVILPSMDVIELPTPLESACYLILAISGIILPRLSWPMWK